MKLVLVYAKYCPYSLEFLPKFEAMKKDLKAKITSPISFKILTKNNYNKTKYNVKSFPCLFLESDDGRVINLDRNSSTKRSLANIVKAINKYHK